MRKTIILLALFLSISSFGQGYVSLSAALDLKNTFVGSAPTNDKPALDTFLQFTAVGNKGTEMTIGYEFFNKINFSKYTIGVGQGFDLYAYPFGKEIKTTLVVGVEPTIINRWAKWGGGISENQAVSFLTLGGNIALRWYTGEKLGLEILYNVLPRTDLHYMYGNAHNRLSIGGTPLVGSFYGKVIYKLN